MFYNIDSTIKCITNNEYSYFLNKANVRGIALGYKKIKNINTGVKCITVFVIKKVCEYMLNKQDIIPKRYRGIMTDVVEADVMKINTLTNRVRPVTGGYNIGQAFKMASSGSYGCIVKDENNMYILSCNHVIADENKAPIGSPILQPAVRHGGQYPNDVIAYLYGFIPLNFKTPTETPENVVDCAIGRIVDLNLVSPLITYVGQIKGIKQPSIGLGVEKVGALTEYTTGTIENTDGSILIDYGEGKECLFKNLILTKKMSIPGDSGTLLLDFLENAVGLIIASNNVNTACNSINEVLSALKVEIVTS